MGNFFYSPDARRDLLEIWEFISRDDLEAAGSETAETGERVLQKRFYRLTAKFRLTG